MLRAVVLVFSLYAGMAAFDLPALWRTPAKRREFWAVAVLMVLGMGFSLLVFSGVQMVSIFKGISAIVKPIGTTLFKAKGEA